MRDYKVGDTIAVKAKVIRATNGSEMPYQVSYITGYDNDGLRSGNSFWVTDSEIVEPVKPVLPKGVADLVKIHKDGYGSLGSFIESVYEPETEVAEWVNAWVYQNSQSDVRYKMLVDAWYNGYTIEKPKLYNLVLGKDSHGDTNAFVKAGDSSISYLVIDPFTDCEDDLQSDSDYQFTQEEIDKYNKNFWIKNLDLNDYKVEVPTDED